MSGSPGAARARGGCRRCGWRRPGCGGRPRPARAGRPARGDHVDQLGDGQVRVRSAGHGGASPRVQEGYAGGRGSRSRPPLVVATRLALRRHGRPAWSRLAGAGRGRPTGPVSRGARQGSQDWLFAAQQVHARGMTLASDDKVLILFRHAKAEQVLGKPDHERELTGRGHARRRARPAPGCTSTSSGPSWCCARPRRAPARPGRRPSRAAPAARRSSSTTASTPAAHRRVLQTDPRVGRRGPGGHGGGPQPDDGDAGQRAVRGRRLVGRPTSAWPRASRRRPWRCCATPGHGTASTSARRTLDRCHTSTRVTAAAYARPVAGVGHVRPASHPVDPSPRLRT